MSNVRTRFAPSPTGYMHIGGMRTALFNWLWARHNGGTFVLRIDDTDRERNIDEALSPILNAFRWLDLDWDEGPEIGGPCGPYFQSERGELYREACERLLSEGKAYRCFDTPDEIRADREAAQREGKNYINVRRSCDLSESQIQQYLEEGRPFVIRYLVPREQTVAIDDAVRGRVEWDGSLIPDPVIVRSNGTPLYNFATAVDDAQMQITHVIRAEEHLSNTPIQVLIHQGLGHELPQFAHIPFVAAPGSKEKLSKRKLDKYRKNPKFKAMFERGDQVFSRIGLSDSKGLDPVMVEYYERIGYLPQGVINGLARLGWSLDDKTEIMSRQTIIARFTLDRVVKSPAGFDPEKMISFQAHWMSQLPIEEKVAGCLPYLIQAGWIADPVDAPMRQLVTDLIVAMGDRLKIFSDILGYDEFFVTDAELHYDEKSVEKRLRKPADAVTLLTAFRDRLAELESFDAATVEATLRSFVETKDIKIGQIIHALRVAVTGKSIGIGMFDALALLGKDKCIARVDQLLANL